MAQTVKFEGQTYQFPDDASDDEIASALGGGGASAPAATAPPAPVAPPPTTAQTVGRKLSLGAQAVGSGAANILGAPVDIVNTAANAGLAGVDSLASLFGGSVPFRFKTGAGNAISTAAGNAVESVTGAELPKPETPAENLVYNVNDFATQGMTGGLGLSRIAAAQTPEAMAGIAGAFTRPYAAAPATAVVMDTAAGAGSGVGHDMAETYFPNNPLADFAATLLGGVTGAGAAHGVRAGADAAVTKGMQKFGDAELPINPNTGKRFTMAESEAAARELQTGVADPSKVGQTISRNANDLRNDGFSDGQLPTSGLLSEDARTVTKEQKARLQDGVPFIERDSAVKAAGADRVGDVRKPEADQAAVPARAAQYRDEQLIPAQLDEAAAEAVARAAEQRRQQEGAAVAVNAGADRKAAASGRLDEAVVDNTYVPERAQKNELFNAVDPNRTEMVDSTPLVEAATRVRDGVNALGPQAAQLPGEFIQRIERLVPRDEAGNALPPQQVALGDVVDLQKYIATARQGALRSGNFELADNLSRLRGAIMDIADQHPAAAAANQNYRENFAPKYRPGPGDEAAKFTKEVDRDGTRTTTPPSATAGRFLSGPEKADALNRILTGSPDEAAGRAAVRDYLQSDMAASVVNPDGTVNPARARRWLDNNADVLERFPQVRQELEGIANSARQSAESARSAGDNLRTARDRVAATDADVNRGAAGTLLRDDPRKVAESILGDKYNAPRRMEEVDRIIGSDAAAREGWRGAVADVLYDRVTGTRQAGDTYEVSYQRLVKEFKSNEAVLAGVFEPKDMSNLRAAHKLLGYFKQAEKRATVGSDTAGKQTLLDTPLGKSSQLTIRHIYGDLKGGGIIRRFRLMASLMPNDKQAMDDIAQLAWFNPDVAAYLLGKKVRDFRSVPANINLRRLIAGEAALNEDDNGEK